MTVYLWIALASLGGMTLGIVLGFWLATRAMWVAHHSWEQPPQIWGRSQTATKTEQKRADSGPVKPMTAEEYAIEREKPMRERIAQLLQPRK